MTPDLPLPDLRAVHTRSTPLSTTSHRTRLPLPQEVREPPTRSRRETASFRSLSAVTRHRHRASTTRSTSPRRHGALCPQFRRDLHRTFLRRCPNRGFIASARDGVFRVFARKGGCRLHRAGRLRHRSVGQLPPRHGRAGRLVVHGTTKVPPFIVFIRRPGAPGGAGGTCRGQAPAAARAEQEGQAVHDSTTSGHSSAASHVHLPPDVPAAQPQLTPAAARALGGAAGAHGGASDRVGARIGSPPVGPHFSSAKAAREVECRLPLECALSCWRESLLRVVGSLRPSLRRSRAGVVAISSGKLSAKAKHIKPSTTQEGEAFRMETLVLGEMTAEGVGHFSPKPNNSRTAKAKEERQSLPHPTLFLS